MGDPALLAEPELAVRVEVGDAVRGEELRRRPVLGRLLGDRLRAVLAELGGVPVPGSGSGQAQLMQSKPSAWFSLSSVRAVRRGPMRSSDRFIETATAVGARRCSVRPYTDDPDRVQNFRRLVTDAAQRPIFMVDWRQRNATFFNALQVERNVMFLILTLIVLVAALNIISGLFMLVKDKGPDIAILRTMGATQGAIMRVFLITGAAYRCGRHDPRFHRRGDRVLEYREHPPFPVMADLDRIVLARKPFPLPGFRRKLDTGEVTAVVVMALTLSLLATLYPSWRAARLDPVEALRYE